MTSTNGRIEELQTHMESLRLHVNQLATFVNHFYGTSFPLHRGMDDDGGRDAVDEEGPQDQAEDAEPIREAKRTARLLRKRQQGTDQGSTSEEKEAQITKADRDELYSVVYLTRQDVLEMRRWANAQEDALYRVNKRLLNIEELLRKPWWKRWKQ